MRPNKYDKYVFLVCFFLFLYSFFFIGFEPVYESEYYNHKGPLEEGIYLGSDGVDEVVGYRYPTSVIIAPLVCILMMIFMVFEEPLRPINRHWVKKKIRGELKKLRVKLRER